mgnify:CR=1 FL=1
MTQRQQQQVFCFTQRQLCDLLVVAMERYDVLLNYIQNASEARSGAAGQQVLALTTEQEAYDDMAVARCEIAPQSALVLLRERLGEFG